MGSLYLDVFSPRLRRRSLCTRTCTSGIRPWRLPSYADGRAHDRAGFLTLLLQHPCLLPPPALKDHSPMQLQCQYAQAIVGIARLASPCGQFPESGDHRMSRRIFNRTFCFNHWQAKMITSHTRELFRCGHVFSLIDSSAPLGPQVVAWGQKWVRRIRDQWTMTFRDANVIQPVAKLGHKLDPWTTRPSIP
ncbi:hypothetical protein IW261DRAFT_459933 [Armillaria novae-zelandiae]|uniref:Uncharacterized protein n=1 Tax=Armillaria novae-zelandiae TaxID=153914 RepID=A0AA39P1J6_9AGAR|nr:hypothetical protein IW261DRAFT_459933 [Armillaria novae-zelandiae]